MIELAQRPDFAIGSADAIKALAKKDRATLLVISDSHGRADVFKAIVEKFGERCDALVFCGDGIGDLCSVLEATKKNKKLCKAFPPVAAFARGNGDYPEFPFGDGEIKVPLHQLLKVAGMSVLVTHGHAEGVYYGLGRLNQEALENQADAVFYGHTHIAVTKEEDCTYFINPGSCSHPRGSQKACFAIVQIPGMQERIQTTFFSVGLSLDGWAFAPYTPALMGW
ncbi:MAG: metallophosphoesterase [Treponema sp.]|nr:metallophosphoesterase [Treponema sp.]